MNAFHQIGTVEILVEPEDAVLMWDLGIWDDDTMQQWLMARASVSRSRATELLGYMRTARATA